MNAAFPWPVATLSDIPSLFWLAPVAGVAALLMARFFSASVMRKSEGDAEMVRIAQAVREGAIAYLKRQYRVVAIVFLILVVFLGLLAALGLQPKLSMLGVPLAGFLSGLTGWFGMKMATNASARTAFAAKQSLNDGLVVAFRSGAVMGLNVVGFALLDISFWFFVLNSYGDFFGLTGGPAERIAEMTTVMLSFGMGASTQALFARVGGGIYTKAADVGADLVGKVEAGIPEDDPRNPATIADNVGDNVGDVAGMGADLYESYYGSILATLALGAAAAISVLGLTVPAATFALQLAAAPIALAGLGILCSIVGIFAVRTKDDASFAQLLKSLHGGVYVASALITVGSFALLYSLFGTGSGAEALATSGTVWWKLGLSIVFGLGAGLVIAYATEYYTSYERPPTQSIAHQALTGPATVIIAGIAEGMKSTWASLLTTAIAILGAFLFAGGADSFLMGLYGVGIAAVGMLSTLGITLATDAYGPIADNAGGNAEMSGQPPEVRKRTDMLDSLGNTTAATGKGFAIGSAALTALALFAAYVQIVQTQLTAQAVEYGKADTGITTPVAIHQGFGKFAIVFPKALADGADYYDGALFLPSHELPRKTLRHLPAGTRLPITAVGDDPFLANRYSAVWPEHNARFDLVSSRQATIDEIMRYYDVTLTNPRVIAGLFIGVLLTFLFCALTMNAVGRAAYRMMRECRRQFAKMREAFRAAGMSEADIANPESWPKRVTHEGVEYPDYANCVSISTAGAQREMIVPSLLAITAPIALGLVLGVCGVLGMLAGGLVSGFAVAVFMANAGGAWDNAKKLLESYGRITATDVRDNRAGLRDKIPTEVREAIVARADEEIAAGRPTSIVYGKGSPDHKATVVGDTVGDPFKDTSGPSLNILIKLISIVSVVFAGLIVRFAPMISHALGLE
jgi:K(+)-stimulated pyrophosphate-energized sodium pump